MKGRSFFKGLFWTIIDKAGTQLVGFSITIYLARLLSPNEFGLIAMASVTISFTRIIIDAGMGDSLIQKKQTEQVDYNSVFYYNVLISVLFFVIIWLTAELIADFFNQKELKEIVRVVSIIPCIYSISVVQVVRLAKKLDFYLIARTRIITTILAGLIAIILAYNEFGVWSLVYQLLLEAILFNIVLWLVTDWRPSLIVSRKIFFEHFKYGSHLLGVQLLNVFYRNVYAIIIGRYFSTNQLGFYTRAESIRSIMYENTFGIVKSVSYPYLSKMQQNEVDLIKNFKKIQKYTLSVILLICLLIMFNTTSFIEILLTKKWLEVAPILQVLLVTMVLNTFNSMNINLLKIKRRTDLYLRNEIINKVILVIILIVSINFGFDALVLSNLVVAFLSIFVNNFFINKVISLSITSQLRDIKGVLFAFILSTVIAYIVHSKFDEMNSIILKLSISSIFYFIVFIFLIWVFDRVFFIDLKSLVKQLYS